MPPARCMMGAAAWGEGSLLLALGKGNVRAAATGVGAPLLALGSSLLEASAKGRCRSTAAATGPGAPMAARGWQRDRVVANRQTPVVQCLHRCSMRAVARGVGAHVPALSNSMLVATNLGP